MPVGRSGGWKAYLVLKTVVPRKSKTASQTHRDWSTGPRHWYRQVQTTAPHPSGARPTYRCCTRCGLYGVVLLSWLLSSGLQVSVCAKMGSERMWNIMSLQDPKVGILQIKDVPTLVQLFIQPRSTPPTQNKTSSPCQRQSISSPFSASFPWLLASHWHLPPLSPLKKPLSDAES